MTYHLKKGGDDVILFTGLITKSHLIKREKIGAQPVILKLDIIGFLDMECQDTVKRKQPTTKKTL